MKKAQDKKVGLFFFSFVSAYAYVYVAAVFTCAYTYALSSENQPLVMDTSVYLVSYDGLLVKTTIHMNVSLSLYLRFYYVEKKKQ